MNDINRPFELFTKIMLNHIGELLDQDEFGEIIFAKPGYYVQVIQYTFSRSLDYKNRIGTILPKFIDSTLDPNNESQKNPILFCKKLNDEEYIKISELHEIYKQENAGNKSDISLSSKRLMFLECIISDFREWYENHDLKLPSNEEDSKNNSNVDNEFPKGWLEGKISQYAEIDKCLKGKTVKSTTIDKWVDKLRKENYPITSNISSSIRMALTRLGFTKEKK